MHYTIAHHDGVSFVYQDHLTLAEFIDRPGIEPGSHRVNAELFYAAKCGQIAPQPAAPETVAKVAATTAAACARGVLF